MYRIHIVGTKVYLGGQQLLIPAHQKEKTKNISLQFWLVQVNVTINWTVAASLILFCTWLHNGAYNTAFTDDWNVRIASVLLLSPLWSIAIAWLIYACTQGYGGEYPKNCTLSPPSLRIIIQRHISGLVTRFLSLPIFLPLSRISYSFYLVHMAIQAITINASESPDSILGSDMVSHRCVDCYFHYVGPWWTSIVETFFTVQ